MLCSFLLIDDDKSKVEKFSEFAKQAQNLIEIMENRNKKGKEELDINGIIKSVWHFLHNFEDGLLGQADPMERSLAFKSCFMQLPTYEELRLDVEDGTIKSGLLKRHIELIPTINSIEELSAPPERLGWNTLFNNLVETFKKLKLLPLCK